MSILSSQSIRNLCRHRKSIHQLIYPFHERTVHNGMTFGLDSAGYDIRIDRTLIMWPWRFALADAIERFNIPANLKMRIADKSTWARRGIFVHNTRAEPGWRGYLRLEIKNESFRFRIIKKGSPIAQVEFETLDKPTMQPYLGKYQDQKPNQNAILEKTA